MELNRVAGQRHVRAERRSTWSNRRHQKKTRLCVTSKLRVRGWPAAEVAISGFPLWSERITLVLGKRSFSCRFSFFRPELPELNRSTIFLLLRDIHRTGMVQALEATVVLDLR